MSSPLNYISSLRVYCARGLKRVFKFVKLRPHSETVIELLRPDQIKENS